MTDRRTDGTGVALTKHIESKFSETQTNTESDITVVTKIAEKVPAKIKALEGRRMLESKRAKRVESANKRARSS